MTCHLYAWKGTECKADIYFELQALSFVHLHHKVQEPLKADPKVCWWESCAGLKEGSEAQSSSQPTVPNGTREPFTKI